MRAVEGVLHSRRDLVPHLLAPLQLEDGGVACNMDHGHRAASGRQQNAQAPIAAPCPAGRPRSTGEAAAAKWSASPWSKVGRVAPWAPRPRASPPAARYARAPQSRTVPVAQSRTPCHTCDGRWRCVDGCRRARGGRPRLAPKCAARQPSGRCHGSASVEVTRALVESADTVPTHRRVAAADAEGWAARRGRARRRDGARRGRAHAAGRRRAAASARTSAHCGNAAWSTRSCV